MSKPRDYLFLLAANGQARLVRHSLVDGGYVTTWRSNAPCDDFVRQIIVEADAQIIDCRLEGLFIVAPRAEIALLRDKLERNVAILGEVDADIVAWPDGQIGPELDRVREGRLPES